MNRNYIALGIFGVVTVGLLFVLASNVGALGGPKGNHYEVRLPHAAGLVDDNAVKIAGVQIGVIHDIRVEHDIAVLDLVVDEDIQLHEDAVAIVRAKSRAPSTSRCSPRGARSRTSARCSRSTRC
jgi:ABC-type transporter Mla subunit MlaD